MVIILAQARNSVCAQGRQGLSYACSWEEEEEEVLYLRLRTSEGGRAQRRGIVVAGIYGMETFLVYVETSLEQRGEPLLYLMTCN